MNCCKTHKVALHFIILFCFAIKLSLAQTPAAFFSIVENVCKAENLQILNQSLDADRFLWDFCPLDMYHLKSETDVVTVPAFLGGFGYKIIEDNGKWFGFVPSQSGSVLYRLDFGNSPLNTPAIVSLGNPGNVLVQPQGIDIIRKNGKWFAFLGCSSQGGTIARLDFGSSLENAPIGIDLGNFGQINFVVWDLHAVNQGDKAILILLNRANDSVIRIDYGDSFENISSFSVFITSAIPGASTLLSFDVILQEGRWVLLITSYFNNTIIKLDYGADLLSDYSSHALYTLASVQLPIRIKIYKESNHCYALVSNNDPSYGLSIIDFFDLDSTVPMPLNVALSPLFSLDGIRWDGKSLISGLGSTSVVKQLTFENECGASSGTSTSASPERIVYNMAGIKPIELIAFNTTSGEHSTVIGNVQVTENVAPDINFSMSENICSNSNITFTPLTSSQGIISYLWNFNDSSPPSYEEKPSHQFQLGGFYSIKLEITAQNGCRNNIVKPRKIYDTPTSVLSMPSGPKCTSYEYIINNETIDTFDGHLTYQWLINNQPVSNERDLRYTFESTGSQEIKLITSIPGCSDEATQTIPQVYEGPAVDFSFTGACDGDEYNFMNLTTGEVATYIWDFGDESSSSAVNPRHTFGSVGNYAVTLTAINDVGCKNTATKTVSVYAAPKADFSILPPPFACSGSETPFTNLTTSPQGTIASYQWQFGDGEGSSTAVNPRYTYTQAGSYQVSLRAESAEGCSDTLEKTITIAPSPSPDFTFTTPCLNTPVTFTNTTSETLKSFYWTIDGSNMFVPSPTRTFRSTGTITATLHATGNNNCLASASKMLTIPVPLQPDFSVTTNCAGHATVFTNETSDGHDPVQSMAWNFSGQGTASISPATFTYSTAGVKQVALTVTAVSGCTYSATKSVNIVSAPKANFTPSLTTGVPPLEVTFTNASTHATHYTWTIPDQPSRITTDVNPVHVFENLGEFHVELKATNAYGCEDVVSKVITAVAPLPDVEVNRVSVTENADGSYRIIVTLKNKGNTVIRNLPLKLDLANHVSLNDQVAGPIQPATLFNYLIPFTVSRSNPLSFVCAIADLPGDLDEENNRVCVQLDDAIFFYPVHPNPVHAFINLEWIARKDWPVSVALVDNTGKKLIDQTLSSAEGFNRRVLDVQGVKEGLYLLLLKHGSARFTQRIFVGGKN